MIGEPLSKEWRLSHVQMCDRALVEFHVRSFARWAYNHGVRPLHRVRIGRSTVTAWSMADLARVTAPEIREDVAS